MKKMDQVRVRYLKTFCSELGYESMQVLDALQRNKRLFASNSKRNY